ncbi:MAG: protein translocase subunit SecD [Rhabdochlamydiaceae bacterium]|nr:protein translocase subunit SecD [Candidatus Amphrikana amoebophyrae]
MEKNKRWQISLIVVVLLLTLYNILPTLFFYSKPLDKPIGQKKSMEIAKMATQRVNNLETTSKEWIQSFAKLLKIKIKSIDIPNDAPQEITVNFVTDHDAALFKQYLPAAGQSIPFYPARLALSQSPDGVDTKSVVVQRKIPIHFSKSLEGFDYSQLVSKEGEIDSLYKTVTQDRLLQLVNIMGGISDNAQLVDLVLHEQPSARSDELLSMISSNILNVTKVFGETSTITKRYFSNFTQGNFKSKSEAIATLIGRMDNLKERVKFEKVSLIDEEKGLQKAGGYLETAKKQQLEHFQEKEEDLLKSTSLLKKYKATFAAGISPLTSEQAEKNIESATLNPNLSEQQTLSLSSHNPLIDKISVDWSNSQIALLLHADIENLRKSYQNNPSKTQEKDLLDQLIFNEIARVSRESGENFIPNKEQFVVQINSLSDAKSMLVLDLKEIAETEVTNITHFLKNNWNSHFKELSSDAFPIVNLEEYNKLSSLDKKYSLLVTSPLLEGKTQEFGFRNSSIYIIAKGLGSMMAKYSQDPNSETAQEFAKEINALNSKLRDLGFSAYPGTTYPLPAKYANDYIFEAENYFRPILQATREEFNVHGTKRYATLEFTDLKQRILRTNAIENAEQEELLKWRDEYYSSTSDPAKQAKFEVPAPTRNPLWTNLALSARKYFRGDDRKILNWGLDLSGGKTVQVELRDHKGKLVTNEDDVNQGINELYNRVNKMGVSEVAIRKEGTNITLDFPGSQALSAKDLIKASSMSFHIVNEKFSNRNPLTRDAINRFLQEVWNEAIVTNKKDVASINAIAWNHLYGDPLDSESANPRSEAAKTLFKNGLRLVAPSDKDRSSAFNDSLSKIAIFRGESSSDWQQQAHPLLVVFNNYGLEGSSLTGIRSGFDPAEGNFLSFEVKGSHNIRGTKIDPQDELFAWTSVFSKDKVSGTPLEKYSGGEGWRMAVVLNDQVVSAPQLAQPLKTNGRITGNFSQRDIGRLESDLKAGSLTFTPHILSEKNVSPELGIKERHSGIIATAVALLLVIVVMVSYYRFAGLIASMAVLINLLIMWATLQNIQATITLATIAGIILTMGMAVDANVLIFERIREEFALSGRIAHAIQTGYKKAFSAILDSNITTIIAALVLLNFDSGPVKGFAVSLIIGLVSSMFTALFLTRCFFRKWAQNPERKSLNMLNLIKSVNFNFLKFAKVAFTLVAIIALVGGFMLNKEKNTIMGMDFTGGYALTLEVEPTFDSKAENSYRSSLETALEKAGLTSQEFQIRELTPSNQLRLFLSKSLELPGHAFASLTLETSDEVEFGYQNNPRISWIVNALKVSGVQLTDTSVKQLESNWTSVSGQMSDSMRNNAMIGLGVALLGILLYITFRFEFKFAISATLGLAIDVLVTMGLIGILHSLGVPVQIDLNTVAALMTIIGYSLNDTIIVFDRIREDMKLMRKSSLSEIINHSLNITLSRTTMTSLTTLVVLIALIAFGGQSIFGFSLVMAIGVVVGTFSTLFIATALLLIFQKKESTKHSKSILRVQ